MSSIEVPGPHGRRTRVDERLVAPESRYEIHDGRIVYVAPADEDHATRHSKVSALLEAHAAEDYDVAVDMLTRTSERDDMAPDASVFPRERHPETGGRQLEELAFELLNTERLGDAGDKAQKLIGRGVRRVFAIDVKRHRAFEWSREVSSWQILSPGGVIEDPALAVPLPIDALVHAAKADDAVAKALLAKKNPILEAAVTRSKEEGKAEGKAEGMAEGKAEGKVEGKAEAILTVLSARGLEPSENDRQRILTTKDLALIEEWLRRAPVCASVLELFDREER